MIYLPLAILNLLWDLVCLIFNPIAILFVDDKGNLPKWLYWFQTHDSSLDLDLPFIQRNWPLLVDKETDSTLVRKLKRYLRHLCWVYRNTGYSFAYDICGASVIPANLDYKRKGNVENNTSDYFFIWEKNKSLWTTRWCLRANFIYGDTVEDGYLRIYLGWKMPGCVENHPTQTTPERVMIACHINPFRNIIGFIKYLWRKIS